MASFFPKMQKSSASFSQSIRNRLRLKKLQAQAKNFCRVLDIRVPQVVDSDALHLGFLGSPVHLVVQVALGCFRVGDHIPAFQPLIGFGDGEQPLVQVEVCRY